MSIEQLWIEYMNVKFMNDWKKMISTLEQCIAQTEDPKLALMAKADLGLIYTAEDDAVKDLEKAQKILEEAAQEGSAPANYYLGNMYYNKGNFAAFYYYRDAVEYGSFLAAYALRDNLNVTQDSYMAKRLVDAAQEQIDSLVEQAREKIDKGNDADGSPQLVLALIGLYDLGVKHGINREIGMMYLEESILKENENAIFMKTNSAVLKPETMTDFKGHTKEDIAKVEKEVKKIQKQEEKEIRRERNLSLLGGIFSVIGTLFRMFFQMLGELLDEIGGDSGASKPTSSELNPLEKYKANHNCNNMPSCIYDEAGNRWDKVSTYENGATYKNFDYGETSIGYCDIESKYATGSRGSFHWY